MFLFNQDSMEPIVFAGYSLQISPEVLGLGVIAMITLSSVLMYYSSKVFFTAYKNFEVEFTACLLPNAYHSIMVKNLERDTVIAQSTTILNKHSRIISEANYYLRYLMESISYIAVYSLAIIVLSPVLGVIFIVAASAVTFLSGKVGDKPKDKTHKIDESNVSVSELFVWIIRNHKYIYSRKLVGIAFSQFSEKVEKPISHMVDYYIRADLKKSISSPALIFLLLGFAYVIATLFKQNLESFIAILLLIYRVLPRFSYLNSQMIQVSRAYVSLKEIENISDKEGHIKPQYTDFPNSESNKLLEIKTTKGWEELHRGQVYCIVGESGSGKTTLLDTIIGTNGYFTNSVNCYYNNKKIVYFNQELCSTLPSKLENLQSAYGIEQSSENFLHIAEKLGVKLNESILDRYSGGEKQRIALAWLLDKDADVILLDEPTSALDQESEKMFLRLLTQKCRDENILVICVSHSKKFAQSVDQVINISEIIND
jgi:ABC-type antimicrobial peptide transport system, ATPase component